MSTFISLARFETCIPCFPLLGDSRAVWAMRDMLLKMWKVQVKPTPLGGQKLGVEPRALSQHTHIAAYLLDHMVGVISHQAGLFLQLS